MSPKDFTDDIAEWDLHSGEDMSHDVEVWLERYVAEKNAMNVSPKTIKSYREAIVPFINFCRQYDSVMTIDGITAKYLNNYLMWYQEQLAQNDFAFGKIGQKEHDAVMVNRKANRGKNDAKLSVLHRYEKSLSHRITVLKQLLLFISENNKEQKDFTPLFKSVMKIKVQKRNTDYLTAKETEELIALMKDWPITFKDYLRRSSERYAWRNGLITLLYCLTGARSDEVVSLQLGHITEDEYTDNDGKTHLFYIIQYHTTKGDKYRELAVERSEIEPFVEYMRRNLPDETYYISSTFAKGKYNNKKMNDSEVYRFVTWALKHVLKIDKSGRHIIRRGYATQEIADGVDISVVALKLGHGSPNTTYSAYVKNNKELMMKRSVGKDWRR